MRLGSALIDGQRRTVGFVGAEAAVLPASAPTPDDAVRSDEARRAAEALIDDAPRVAVDALRLLAPLTRFPRNLLCTGWNYWDHFEESKGKREGQDPAERPTHPTFFTKAPLSVIGPADPIAWDSEISAKWDYEAELAVVIGTAGRSIPAERALDHIVGALVANDVSQRDVQRAHGGQWFRGKSVDGASPLGPYVTFDDEYGDLQALDIRCDLNGETLQSANTRQMAFSIADIIAELSWGMTLLPGDVILTGTPSGIGNAREPQIFLRPGDVVTTTVQGLGELRNVVEERDLHTYRSGVDAH